MKFLYLNPSIDKSRTYLLALDGDVDFESRDFELVLDRLSRNPDVAACCNQIHPAGSGPMVWFQKFEYAIGHWFQKSAEHTLGCVLWKYSQPQPNNFFSEHNGLLIMINQNCNLKTSIESFFIE